MKNKTKIACLPVAGRGNPYQYLMIDGLNSSENIHAFNGIDDRFFGIIRTYFKYKPDYIHFDWITSYYYRRKLWMTFLLLPIFIFQILYLRYLTKTKIVWTLHNIVPHDVKNKRLHQRIRSFFAKKTTWIRVFSDTSIKRAVNELKVDARKFKVIPEGDYKSVYENSISKEKAREILGIDTSKFVFLSLGFIKPYKGLDKLIDVFLELKLDNAVLIIAGDNKNDDYLEKLKTKIGNKIDRIKLIPEFIPDSKLQIYYNSADVVVLPFNKIENSGSVIMAMGFNKPVIAPKTGVVEKRLCNQTELLYDPGDLKEKMEFAYINKDILDDYGKKNFTELDKYSWEDYIKAFV